MKSPIQAIKSDKTIRQAAGLMKSNEFGSLLVIHKGEVGIITERDLLYALAEFGENTSISGHVSMPLISINEEESISKASDVMIENNIRHLGVTGKDGKLVGIVNMRDILSTVEHKFPHLFEE